MGRKGSPPLQSISTAKTLYGHGRMHTAEKFCYILVATGLIFVQALAANTITEETIAETGEPLRKLTLNLKPPGLNAGDAILVTGLTGSQTSNTDSLAITIGTESTSATAKWIQSNGTLIVTLTEPYTAAAETSLVFSATIKGPNEAQETRNPSFSIYRVSGNTHREMLVNSTVLTRLNQKKILFSSVFAAKRRIVESGFTTRSIKIILNLNTKMNVGDNITIEGLTGSNEPTTDTLSASGLSATMFNNRCKWDKDSGRLIFTSNTNYAANSDIILVVNISQPLLANAAISARISTDWLAGALLPTPLLGCILVVPVVASTKTIEETGVEIRELSISLRVNVPMVVGDIITIRGLTGSATSSTQTLPVTGPAANKFNSVAAWTQSSGTVVLTASASHVENTHINFTIALARPTKKNVAVSPKIFSTWDNGDISVTPMEVIGGDIMVAAGFTTQPYISRTSNKTKINIKYIIDSNGEVTCGVYAAWSIKPTANELLTGESSSIFNETLVHKYVSAGKTINVQKNVLDSTYIDGLSPYVPYDIYCVTESEIFGTSQLYDVYTYGLKTKPGIRTSQNNSITAEYILTDSYSGNVYYDEGTCTNPLFNNQRELCEGEGTCADANGVVGNGAAYNNDKAACEQATDCGDEISNDPCLWFPTNTWNITCTDPDKTTQEECEANQETEGTCRSASGGIGGGAEYSTRTACEAACPVCGYDQCIFYSNNTFVSGAVCSEATYTTQEDCDKALKALNCKLYASLPAPLTLSTGASLMENLISPKVNISGTGLSNAPTTTSGSGSGATLNIVVSGGMLVTANVQSVGTGYATGDILIVSSEVIASLIDLVFILGPGSSDVFDAFNASQLLDLTTNLTSSPPVTTGYYLYCLTDKVLSEMTHVYKLSSSPLILGTNEIEVTDDIVLYAEVDVGTTLKISSSKGYSHTLSKPSGINDERIFNIKSHGNLSLFNLKLTMGNVGGKSTGEDCSNNNGAAICLWHKSSVLFLRNVTFFNNVVGPGGYGGAIYAQRGYVEMYHVYAYSNWAQSGVIADPFHICEDYVVNGHMPDTYFDPAPLNETYFKYEGWKCNGIGIDVTVNGSGTP